MTNEHIEKLRRARMALVDARRNWATTVAKPGPSSEVARQFTHYQQGIEAIDRAIADEEKLGGRGQ
jgi:hypothetical protein